MSNRGTPRRITERRARWLLSLYPPFLFQRIRIASVAPGFRRVTVRVSKSLLTRNLNGTIFGGTIYSAADPIYAVMLWQIFAWRDMAVRVWLRRASVRFLAPADSTLTLDFEVDDDVLARAEAAMAAGERFSETFLTPAVDRSGTVCAEIETEIVIRPR